MKLHLLRTLSILFIASALTACGKKDETSESSAGAPKFASGSTMAKIQERGVLNVATKFDAKLFGQKNPLTGKLEGFDIEMAHAIAKRIFGNIRELPSGRFQARYTAPDGTIIKAPTTFTE